tara:strand:+ start:4690 stop:4866 length:177 start_codon:yes stop_codon:yes gene_type:complete
MKSGHERSLILALLVFVVSQVFAEFSQNGNANLHNFLVSSRDLLRDRGWWSPHAWWRI